MKPKYQIGTLVEINHGDETGYGLVAAIITTKTEFKYMIEGSDEKFAESDIVAGYKPIAGKTAKRTTRKKDAQGTAPTAKKTANVGRVFPEGVQSTSGL